MSRETSPALEDPIATAIQAILNTDIHLTELASFYTKDIPDDRERAQEKENFLFLITFLGEYIKVRDLAKVARDPHAGFAKIQAIDLISMTVSNFLDSPQGSPLRLRYESLLQQVKKELGFTKE